jgi:hypothetical protein
MDENCNSWNYAVNALASLGDMPTGGGLSSKAASSPLGQYGGSTGNWRFAHVGAGSSSDEEQLPIASNLEERVIGRPGSAGDRQ